MASSADHPEDAADVGLLSPVTAGTAVEAITSDAAVLSTLVRVEAALSAALASTGVANTGSAEVLSGSAGLDARDLALASAHDGNPVVPLVQRLRADAGSAAEAVHHGATSQDIVDTALMVVADQVRDRLRHDLGELGDTLASLAHEHERTLAVARTLTQQALPTTLGFRVAGWLAAVDDAKERTDGLSLPASLGGPVGTAAAYGAAGPAVLEELANRLGLSVPVSSWHTRRTAVLDLVHALTAVTSACGTIAGDVLVMAQTELGEASEGDPGGSSSMPHKHNPAQSVLVASAAARMAGPASVLIAAATSRTERPPGVWHAEWAPLREALRLGGASAERALALVRGLRFDYGALDRNLDHLLAALGKDRRWAQEQTNGVQVWIARVLKRHEERVR